MRLTKDLKLVVHHDPNVDRTTNFKGDIASFTYAQLQVIDSAYQYTPKGPGKGPYFEADFPFRNAGYYIPLFSTFMDAFEDSYKNIEIKDNLPLAAELVWQEIQRKHSNDFSKVIVASGHCDVLHHFRKVSGGLVATSACEKEGIAFFLTQKLGIGNFWFWLFPPVAVAYQAPVVSNGLWLNLQYFVDAAHSMDQKLMYWVINDGELAHQLLDLGADGIVSDRADLIYQSFYERKLVQTSLQDRLQGITVNSTTSFYIPESNPREVHSCLTFGCIAFAFFVVQFKVIMAVFLGCLVLAFVALSRTSKHVAHQPLPNANGSRAQKKKQH